MILMLDRDHAQKIIVAIKHAAKENGWDI